MSEHAAHLASIHSLHAVPSLPRRISPTPQADPSQSRHLLLLAWAKVERQGGAVRSSYRPGCLQGSLAAGFGHRKIAAGCSCKGGGTCLVVGESPSSKPYLQSLTMEMHQDFHVKLHEWLDGLHRHASWPMSEHYVQTYIIPLALTVLALTCTLALWSLLPKKLKVRGAPVKAAGPNPGEARRNKR